MTTFISARADRFPLGNAARRTDLALDPHPTLRRLRQAEPVSWCPDLDGWLVTDRELVIAALRDTESFTVDDPRFSTGQVLGPSMLSLDGQEHRRHRDPFVGPFRPAAVMADYQSLVIEEANRLVSALQHRGHGELRTELAGPLAVSVISRALGLSDTDDTGDTEVLSWYRAIVSAVLEVSEGRAIPGRSRQAVDSLRQRVAAAIESGPTGQQPMDGQPMGERRSFLPGIADRTDLSGDEIFSNVAVLMFGAIETCEGMTSNALLHLLSNTEQLAELGNDGDLIDKAIDESLRLEPAAAVVDRYATDNIDFGRPGREATIGKGELVILSLAGANRDPATFEDPDRFDIHRANAGAHLAFVQGPHACIGAHLARLETRAAIAAVIHILPGIALDSTVDASPTGLIFRKPERLITRWPTH